MEIKANYYPILVHAFEFEDGGRIGLVNVYVPVCVCVGGEVTYWNKKKEEGNPVTLPF